MVITRLAGKLLGRSPHDVIVDVHGVGFAVTVPMSTFDTLPPLGHDVLLHTHFHLREDSAQLFGFASEQERQLFRLLISVTGIGTRLALNALSAMSVKQFCATIAAGDLKMLAKINGVGKRTAERLVVELKERVDDVAPHAGLGVVASEGEPSRDILDAVAALETLGFKNDAARRAVQKAAAEADKGASSAEVLIRRALASLNS